MSWLKWQTPELVLCSSSRFVSRYCNCYDYHNLPPETLKMMQFEDALNGGIVFRPTVGQEMGFPIDCSHGCAPDFSSEMNRKHLGYLRGKKGILRK